VNEAHGSDLPAVVLFNINGSGMGHMSTCLAYANRLRGRARPVFFSNASAMEFIHEMGYEGDYMVSRFWSRASSWDYDRQLALRLGILFERVRPKVVLFDGTWPYRGLLHAIKAYGGARSAWSDLTLYKPGWREVPVSKDNFDLVIKLGEIGADFRVDDPGPATRQVTIPPLTILRDEDILDRDAAREALGLRRAARYALFSLGPGNLKDVSEIGLGLMEEVRKQGYEVIWTRAPISAADVVLPEGVVPLSVYPTARYMLAFDVFVGAAGYNTCCEVLQSRVPALFVPNSLVADDQFRRAQRVARLTPAVVSACETPRQRAVSVAQLHSLVARSDAPERGYALDGAERAADEIIALTS
jgi:UDP-N-acetylglucosamine--N-acetylmuramyl-(pentapeptide) pyrophosphoryl-undecaprenol N-acetylglucosamine transferase